MTAASSPTPLSYPRRTRQRAERALRCAPFRHGLFSAMKTDSIALKSIAAQGPSLGYSHRPMAELVVEESLIWLIQVGVLRREVDGQGITDRFRLTPLGHLLVDRYVIPGEWPPASPWDWIVNNWCRWVRSPI